ncbi:MAG: BREX system P-loop protein BrxC [Actinobacteria bacterium]|nr:BREX system P-loop protein BrxC [Actinomycetota bacterium]
MMKIRDIFKTRVEEKIEPVIKVGDRADEHKLASEIGSYVVTPTIERYLDDFLEHYSDTFRISTEEVGVWISGYFGSGKSHLAKIAALLIENRTLEGIPASKRFETRVPAQAPHHDSMVRSLSRLSQCDSKVLAFNINTLSDSRTTPLARLLLSQFYQAKGYSSNLLYARVIEAELDKRGKLSDLHIAAAELANKSWEDIQKNLAFYAKPLYQAACKVAPEVFSSTQEVDQALKSAERGELYNVQFLVRTILDDIEEYERSTGKPCRFVFVLDESGQWIEDEAERLYQLQALVEEAASAGQGKIWIFVTTHEDTGSIYQNARALKADMKKIEGRFRFKWNLTTENIELVLEDRIFKKSLAGKDAVAKVYNENPGVLRDLGELKNTAQKLPEASEERFVTFYPFFPYQIHLIPEIVKSLRSAGGRGEQLAGSTRTLLAITQDILRAGRRNYLDLAIGELVSFDELYENLAGEGEVTPDARRELNRIEEIVPEATSSTRRTAEVLYLIREIAYIPRTIDNIARLLVEHTTEDLTSIISRVEPELKKLIKAKLVAKIGEEYEFLTGERRTFEEEVAEESAGIKWQDLEAGLARFAKSEDVLGFTTIPYKGKEFNARIFLDGTPITKEGFTEIQIHSPLSVLAGTKISDLEDQSLRPSEDETIFVLSDRIPELEDNLRYYLAMRTVIDRWKGDPHKSADAHKLASERESNDLDKLRRKLLDSIREGLRHAHIIFRGASRAISPKVSQSPGETLRSELSAFWPSIYHKFDRVPVRIVNEQKAIIDVLKGAKDLSPDVRELDLTDKTGQVNPHSPLLDTIRTYISPRQSKKERTLGKDIITEFEEPPYGWDPGAVRVGVAALVRSGAIKVQINKKPYTNPLDPELQNTLRLSRDFDKAELILEIEELAPDVLTEVRKLLIQLTGTRKIDETPAALSAVFEEFAHNIVGKATKAQFWAETAELPLPVAFKEGKEVFEKILGLTNPVHRVNEINNQLGNLGTYIGAILEVSSFVDKWGKAFIDMRKFAVSLSAIRYRLPRGGSCEQFISNWGTANSNASVTNSDTWRALQDAKGSADLELGQLINSWKDEARGIAQEALNRLPQDLEANELPVHALQQELSLPLEEFISSIDGEVDPVRVSMLPDRAEELVKSLGMAIQAEREKRKPKPEIERPPKPVKRIRMADVTTMIRIQDEGQWDQVRDRLDEAVRNALASGNDVELG